MNIVISGYGAMGKTLEKVCKDNENADCIGVVDFKSENTVRSFEELTVVPDVIIDFSHPDVLDDLLAYALKNKVCLMIATTNYTQKQLSLIEKAAATIPILKATNTSLGITVLLNQVKQLKKQLPDADIEIIEHHHNNKIDTPSGTAKSIYSSLRNENSTIINGRKNEHKRQENEIGIHSIRGGTITGYHEVIFALDQEVITLSHRAESKEIFAKGALNAAGFITGKSTGLYTMNDIISEEK
ncbi:MAG: 4-hydroxy-tetrahydrodipicolinate reductase [Candidatus Izimaplasma sp.]|nr:4-hydroxy-tetrahydrodipicolinate reductase [Candidatus Izimaplasma bacterium]